MKSYCVKQRKQTECLPGSETYAMARNGRRKNVNVNAMCRMWYY